MHRVSSVNEDDTLEERRETRKRLCSTVQYPYEFRCIPVICAYHVAPNSKLDEFFQPPLIILINLATWINLCIRVSSYSVSTLILYSNVVVFRRVLPPDQRTIRWESNWKLVGDKARRWSIRPRPIRWVETSVLFRLKFRETRFPADGSSTSSDAEILEEDIGTIERLEILGTKCSFRVYIPCHISPYLVNRGVTSSH